MKPLLPLLALLLAACSTTIEKMDKGTPTGDHYVWVNNHMGSKVTWKTSMGSSYAGDSEKSFADLMQFFGIASTNGLLKARELTQQHEAGQITLRERNAGLERIAMAEQRAKTVGGAIAKPETVVNPITVETLKGP